MDALVGGAAGVTQQFAVRGMTCSACAEHVAAALAAVPGVQSAHVDFPTALATVQYDPASDLLGSFHQAVAEAGYSLEAAVPVGLVTRPLFRPVAVGLLAALGLVTFYLGVITIAQDWTHALQQLAEDRWFVSAIVAGFGVQLGLFTYLRGLHTQVMAGGVAASTGTSTAAMLACCAHHLVDVLPILGLSGAAIFLNLYKTPLLWLGIGMNLVGIAYLTRQILQQQGAASSCHHGTSMNVSRVQE